MVGPLARLVILLLVFQHGNLLEFLCSTIKAEW
jgi:hypothetical protein